MILQRYKTALFWTLCTGFILVMMFETSVLFQAIQERHGHMSNVMNKSSFAKTKQASSNFATKLTSLSPVNPLHFPDQGHEHNYQLTKTFRYNSNPPTSGPHAEIYPPKLVSDKPFDVAALVHMLEHGNIVIVYNSIPASELNTLRSWVDTRNYGIPQNNFQSEAEAGSIVFLCPWPSIQPGTIDALAWTRMYPLQKLNISDLNVFVSKWQGAATRDMGLTAPTTKVTQTLPAQKVGH